MPLPLRKEHVRKVASFCPLYCMEVVLFGWNMVVYRSLTTFSHVFFVCTWVNSGGSLFSLNKVVPEQQQRVWSSDLAFKILSMTLTRAQLSLTVFLISRQRLHSWSHQLMKAIDVIKLCGFWFAVHSICYARTGFHEVNWSFLLIESTHQNGMKLKYSFRKNLWPFLFTSRWTHNFLQRKTPPENVG